MDHVGERQEGELDELHFTSSPTSGDLLRMTASTVRRSAGGLTFGTMITAEGVAGVAVGDLPSLVPIALGLSLLTGLFVIPFLWLAIRRRRDLMLATLSISVDDNGISISSPLHTTTLAWSVYRGATETNEGWALDSGAGRSFVARRGMDVSQVDAFRAFLARAGLLDQRDGWRNRIRPVIWVALGLGLAASLLLGPRFLASFGATARMEVTPRVDGRSITVHGTTDLPDGAIVGVNLVQLDQWNQSASDGAQPDITTSPWVQYDEATVTAGAFDLRFEVPSWPPGRALVDATFSVDSRQPSAVSDRFGLDGSQLRGLDVTDLPDLGRTLEVQVPFDLPE